jgi:hypothetical protein
VKLLHIEITAPIPDDNHEVGHEAIVAMKEPVDAVMAKLRELGLDPKQSKNLVVKRPAAKPAAAPIPELREV